MAAALGILRMREAVQGFGEGHPFTALVPDLSGPRCPRLAFSGCGMRDGFGL